MTILILIVIAALVLAAFWQAILKVAIAALIVGFLFLIVGFVFLLVSGLLDIVHALHALIP